MMLASVIVLAGAALWLLSRRWRRRVDVGKVSDAWLANARRTE